MHHASYPQTRSLQAAVAVNPARPRTAPVALYSHRPYGRLRAIANFHPTPLPQPRRPQPHWPHTHLVAVLHDQDVAGGQAAVLIRLKPPEPGGGEMAGGGA